MGCPSALDAGMSAEDEQGGIRLSTNRGGIVQNQNGEQILGRSPIAPKVNEVHLVDVSGRRHICQAIYAHDTLDYTRDGMDAPRKFGALSQYGRCAWECGP